MKVQFKKDWKCYIAPNGVFKKGEVIDLSLANAQTVLDNGFADKYIAGKSVETAEKKPKSEKR